MITIIAENKNMALAIARATLNDEVGNRYYYGDKFFITWTFGKMVEITTPRGQASYWFRSGSFPHIPKHLTLSITSRNDTEGTPLAYEASAQIEVIKNLLAKSESVIAATAPTQKGELIFRYLYAYLKCKLPYTRALINDLCNKTILRAITQPQPAEKFDNWYRAARLRDEADWIIGINARRSLAFAAGRGTYRIGRTSASVLKKIQERNKEVKAYQPEKFTYGTVAIKDNNGNVFALSSKEPLTSAPANSSTVKILSCTANEVKIKQPKLYNLIQLQLDAAEKYGMSPLRTYEAAIRLFDRKLISYPIEASTTVSYRKYTACRSMLEKLLAFKNYASVACAGIDFTPGRSVGKETIGTHGIVITPVPAFALDDDMARVYHLIVRRMYQAFSREVVIIKSHIIAECEGVTYEWDGVAYKTKGWHSLFSDTVLSTSPIPYFKSETAEVFSVGHVSRNIARPEAYTDATLIRGLIEERGIVHSTGIAKDIVHLELSGLIERDAWGQISLTERGRALYGLIKDMEIADIKSVKETDSLVRELLKDNISASAYDRKLKQITRDLTAGILASARLYPRMEADIPCPQCSEGTMKTFGKIAKCDNPDCGHYLFRQYYGVTLNHEELSSLIETGSTPIINGFHATSGKIFKAKVIINSSGSPQVVSNHNSSNSK